MRPVPKRILELARTKTSSEMEEYLLRLKIAHEACRLQRDRDLDPAHLDEVLYLVVEDPK